MVKKKDLVKVFYIYICLCHVCPAHPCGDNPLRQLVRISSSTGRDLQNVLITLRHINVNAYQQLRNEFQRYAACVGVVDTGYFKRSTDAFLPTLKRRLEKEPSLDDIIDLMSYDDVIAK
ncbi:hypothetical protein FSP39_019001 [Pinctada imbricata]|uniref:Uncharacterized protein n=1 Tax=Pinctada imbricata TaxID=66713 RepID=A0AA89BJM0_PINIB|nr:hypothetical protein FSP39_019001 [Pinctada imbricata]